MADIIVIAVLIGILALIVRGMRRRSTGTCHTTGCGGNCASCVAGCSAPRLQLTEAQERELRELHAE